MRTFAPTASADVRLLLDRLARPADEVGPDAYRAAMRQLGEQFARLHRETFTGISSLLLVCTNEDADFLASGILDTLEVEAKAVRVACFWNARQKVVGASSGEQADLAPITRRYVEPGEAEVLLVVKSIISSACVVRTNITELVYDRRPTRVLIFAPVVLAGAEDRLRAEFEATVADLFRFFWFAQDTDKSGDDVIPGIGGQVYERLGIGSAADKNRYTPDLVRRRRAGR